jgi:hypothetical protein
MSLVYLAIDPKGCETPASNAATFFSIQGTTFPVSGFAFADTGNNDILFRFTMPMKAGSAGISGELDWYSATGQTTGSVRWSYRFDEIGATDNNETFSMGGGTLVAATAVSGTAKGTTRTSFTAAFNPTSGASCECRIRRAGSDGSDTMTGAANLVGITLSWSDT